jgi:hypothetical protein
MTASRKPNSRAEQVRSRRAKDIKQRVVIATDSVVKPGRYTPVTTRGDVDAIPFIQQGHKKTKRKFYLPLIGGAELRLPAIPIIKPGWRLASAAIFILAGLGLYAIWEAPVFKVNSVKLVGGNRVSSQEIQNIIPLKGQRMLTIMPGQIATVIRNAFPVLADVQVTVGIPDSITVSLEERKPVLAWEQDDSTQWISADGIAFEPKGDAKDLVTIQANGNPPTGKTNLTLMQQDQTKSLASLIFTSAADKKSKPAVLQPVKSFIDPQMIPAIQEIAKQVPAGVNLLYEPRYGLGWEDPQGWKVFFGMNPKDMPAKLNMYKTITAKLTAQGIHPTLISMENLYAPYYRSEQ